MAVKLHLLGTPVIEIDGENVPGTGAKVLALLAYLACERSAHSRESLAAIFWGENTQARALASLRQNLFKVRSILPPDYLQISRLTVSMAPHPDLWVDAVQLIQLVHRETRPSAAELADVVALYRGEFMSGIHLSDSPEFEAWQNLQRQRVEASMRTALNQLIDYQMDRAAYEQATQFALQLVSINPLDEAAHRLLMRLYLLTNQPFAAINQYHICVELLDNELGIFPEPETRDLYQQIIERQEGSPHDASKGLIDAPAFPVAVYPARPEGIVGREHDLSQVRSLLNAQLAARNRGIVAIQGWPGVGKSALVALLAHDTQTVSMFPDGVLWAALGEHADILGILSKWAHTLGMADDQAERSLEEISMWLRTTLRGRRILFIVDDIWTAEALHWFHVGDEQSALVVTTRMNDIARDVIVASEAIYKLDILDDDSAMHLMRQLAPDVTAAYPHEMLELIHDLEGLPLALQVAGRLLQSELEMGWGITDLLADLREGVALLEAKAPVDRADPLSEITPTISALLAQSTNRLDEVNRLRFASLGLFAPKPATFSADTLAAIWEVKDPRESIRLLVNRGLMEPVGSGRFQVHALLVRHAQSLFAI